MIRRRVIVTGHVQGVFFRDTCRQLAAEHGVAGWVRNRDDGSVEAVFEGEPDRVTPLVDWARRGPRAAHVDDIDVHDEEPEGLADFELR